MAVEPGRGPADWFPDEEGGDGWRRCQLCGGEEIAEPIAPTRWRRGSMTAMPYTDVLPSQYVCVSCRSTLHLLYHEAIGWILDPKYVRV